MSLLLAGLLLAQAPATPSRETRVLALLQELASSGCFRYSHARFEEVEPRVGSGPVVVPHVSAHCMYDDTGTFDAARARQIAAECFRIFGFEVQSEHSIREDECEVTLDGVNLEARLGFELAGLGCRDLFGQPEPESPEVALDADEARWLAEQGYRLHVADVGLYRGCGDEFTPILAYIAGVVGFLDTVTEGEDVRLDGLLASCERGWSLPAWELEEVEHVTVSGWPHELEIVAPTTIRLRFRGDEVAIEDPLQGVGSIADETPVVEPPLWIPTMPAPSALMISGLLSALDPSAAVVVPKLRLRQAIGGQQRVHEGAGYALLLPRDFNLFQPFQLEIEVPPSRGWLYAASFRGGFTR